VTAPSESSVPAKVGEEVDRLLSGGLKAGQIGVVSLRGKKTPGTICGLASIGRHSVVDADSPNMEDNLVADSFLRWKGLERPAVIVTDLSEAPISNLAIRLNVAMSRSILSVRFVGTKAALAASGLR